MDIFSKILHRLILLLVKIIKPSDRLTLINKIFHNEGVDIYKYACHQIGILNPGKIEVTGEKYFIDNYLARLVPHKNAVYFDIGANVGSYSSYLAKIHSYSKIYAFEPNQAAFSELKKIKFKNIYPYNIAFGENKVKKIFYSPDSLEASQLSTFSSEALMSLGNNLGKCHKNIIKLNTLDSFIADKLISHVDFVKIDVEGFEYNVLLGTKNNIKNSKIPIIQFEFNLHNVYQRIFLKDFYKLLKNYRLYRLHPNKLIPLGKYDTKNEIFLIQNIVAIHNKIYLPL